MRLCVLSATGPFFLSSLTYRVQLDHTHLAYFHSSLSSKVNASAKVRKGDLADWLTNSVSDSVSLSASVSVSAASSFQVDAAMANVFNDGLVVDVSVEDKTDADADASLLRPT